MVIQETNIRKVTFQPEDIKQALIMYAKSRGENITENDIELYPETMHATSTITKTTEPKTKT